MTAPKRPAQPASQASGERLIPAADLRAAVVPSYWTDIHSDAEVRAGMRSGDWSQAHLARLAGITQKHLSEILLGKQEGTLTLWAHLLLLVSRAQELPSVIEAVR